MEDTRGTAREIDEPTRLDFSKVIYHPSHLQSILRVGGEAYPIHVDLGLVNYCNHDCTFCYARRSMFDSMSVTRERIDKKRLFDVIAEMASLGLKSVTLVGSGEPTLHPESDAIIAGIRDRGVEVGLFSNGSGLRTKVNEAIAQHCTFIRFSLTGASRKIHDLVHANHDYDKIMENINELVSLRGLQKQPTIGIQFVLASYSAEDVVKGAQQARDLGVDYYEIKPVFPSIGKVDQLANTLPPEKAIELLLQAKALETETFTVYAKIDQLRGVFANVDDRTYHDCPGCRTSTTLEADFNLYICDNQKIPKYCFGNLRHHSFKEVWHDERRHKIMEELNVHECPPHCRMHPLNVLVQQIRDGELALPRSVSDPDSAIHPNFL